MKLFTPAALGLLAPLAACAPATPSITAAADPSLGLRQPRYAPVTAGVRGYDVVEPKDWREMNRGVAPGAPERGDTNDDARRGR
ncbi:hypothetical protein SLNSH_23820 [Alsobacter soli]|uniref:Uncharacterized protein n=1 Tax=Alsobacter soli TaxID=2109933 RepID=A0A2T1HLE5_9HYPH|nr:hypothetical protein [Alsobacter soli]PSC02470.1 hypothetical protein SLNSH_23820 [Alsobacter soli]